MNMIVCVKQVIDPEGSSQHMSGCSGSNIIVAINKDPETNISKEVRFAQWATGKKYLP